MCIHTPLALLQLQYINSVKHLPLQPLIKFLPTWLLVLFYNITTVPSNGLHVYHIVCTLPHFKAIIYIGHSNEMTIFFIEILYLFSVSLKRHYKRMSFMERESGAYDLRYSSDGKRIYYKNDRRVAANKVPEHIRNSLEKSLEKTKTRKEKEEKRSGSDRREEEDRPLPTGPTYLKTLPRELQRQALLNMNIEDIRELCDVIDEIQWVCNDKLFWRQKASHDFNEFKEQPEFEPMETYRMSQSDYWKEHPIDVYEQGLYSTPLRCVKDARGINHYYYRDEDSEGEVPRENIPFEIRRKLRCLKSHQ